MLISKVEDSLKNINEDWRNIKNYKVGDTISVKYQYAGVGLKIRKFVGVCIARRQKGMTSVILLRNVVSNKGVEMLFFLESNKVISVQKLNYKRNKVKRSKLYYLRDKPLSKSKISN